MEDRYLVEMSDGQTYGPGDLATLKEWAAQGRLHRTSTLILERTGERLRADTLPGLFPSDVAGAPPVMPEPPPSVSAAGPQGHPPHYAPPVPRKNNTTLIVVVVVLAVGGLCILPVLAAILFPVFAQARQAAQRTQGLSGMKQLGTGILIYGADFDDHFPPAMESARALEPAIGRFVKMPGAFESRNPRGGEILGDKRLSGRNQMNLVDPPNTIMLYDSLPWSGDRSPVARADGSAKIIPFASINSLMTPDPFGGMTIKEEREQESAATAR